jgi:malonyl-CoA decarboxylase
MTSEEVEQLKSHLQTDTLWSELRQLFKTNSWATDSKLVSLLEVPLMRLCAGYLYLEKRRGYALDSVGKIDSLICTSVKLSSSS